MSRWSRLKSLKIWVASWLSEGRAWTGGMEELGLKIKLISQTVLPSLVSSTQRQSYLVVLVKSTIPNFNSTSPAHRGPQSIRKSYWASILRKRSKYTSRNAGIPEYKHLQTTTAELCLRFILDTLQDQLSNLSPEQWSGVRGRILSRTHFDLSHRLSLSRRQS